MRSVVYYCFYLSVLWLVSGCATPPLNTLAVNPLSVKKDVTLAGVLNEGAEQALSRHGAFVIDLRTSMEEGVSSEAQALEKAGVTYSHLPIGRSPLSSATVQTFQHLLSNHPDQPILVHCSSGNRAGVLWAATLIEQGQTVEDAMKAVDVVVTRDSTRQAIRDYAARRTEQ